MSGIAQRIAPHSEEAEGGLLGSILLDGEANMGLAVLKGIRPEAFYVPAHREVFEAMLAVTGRGRPVDLLTIGEELRSRGVMDRIGGPTALDKFVDATPTQEHCEHYAEIVLSKWRARGVIETARETESEAYGDEDGNELVGKAIEKLSSLLGYQDARGSNFDLAMQRIKRFRDAKAGIAPAIGIELPWGKLTSVTCGLEPGIFIVAGRPSSGKTTFEDQVADYVTGKGVRVGRATMDSTREELLERTMCRRAGVSLPKLKFGYARESQIDEMEKAATHFREAPMSINDWDTDITAISTWWRLLRRRLGMELATVDYAQLIMAEEMGRQNWDVTARVTYVSQRLKRLAVQELKIPIMVLCQLNRLVEQEKREPQLSDLKDSGGLEQDAHKVLFLYVDAKKRRLMEEGRPGATKHKRPVWANVLKHKGGDTQKVALWMYPAYFRFEVAQDQSGDFADDELPGESDADEGLMRKRPEYIPADEGNAEFIKACGEAVKQMKSENQTEEPRC